MQRNLVCLTFLLVAALCAAGASTPSAAQSPATVQPAATAPAATSGAAPLFTPAAGCGVEPAQTGSSELSPVQRLHDALFLRTCNTYLCRQPCLGHCRPGVEIDECDLATCSCFCSPV